MAINFPANPSNGDVHAGFTYNSTKSVWEANSPSMMATSDTAPTSPSDGQMWFDTDGGGTFVYYEDADSSQWVEVIGSQGSPGADGAAGADGGAGMASVYATVNDLPTSGNSQGDMAHVTANNTLYFWNGSGWYKIALINANPSISGVASAYTLASDGTATVITITASDPEGLPITYSIASDTSGDIATVTQGAGASSNVFTITPSTSEANAGSFTLTFRASDGVNIATAPASFTLQFSVQNSNYTTALITSVGANNAVNNSFVDSSSSNLTLTAASGAQNTFSPYRQGGYSTYFDGSGDNLSLADNAAFDLSTGDFTMEAWIYPTALSYDYPSIISAHEQSDNTAYIFGLTNTNKVMLYGGGTGTIYTSTSTFSLNEWTHVMVTRSSGTIRFFINGTLDASTYSNSGAFNCTASGLKIGQQAVGSGSTLRNFTGYLTDVRMIKGTALQTSSFTAPTERLTAITNTSLLTCHLPYIADGSTNSHSITVNGNTSTKPFAPFDYVTYSASTNGGSIYSNGAHALTIPSDLGLRPGTGDFTLEFWWYPTSNSDAQYIYAQNFNDGNTGYANFLVYANTASVLFYSTTTGSSWNIHSGANVGAYSVNQWHHIAISRESGTIRFFLNGVESNASTTNTADYSNTGGTRLGTYNGTTGGYYGSISDVRFVNGNALYTAAFTPPTAPLTNITNTALLINGTNAGIIDKSQSIKDYISSGSVSSTAQTKYLSSSIYFDGVNDYARWTNNDGFFDLGFNGEPFTMEHWQYFPSIVNGASIGIQTGGGAGAWSGSNGHQLTVFFYSSAATLFYQWWNGSSRTDYEFNHGGAFTAGTWQHFATVYDGTNLSTYVDGTRIGHRTSGNTFGSVTTKYASLGSNATTNQGLSEVYYSDVRVTKGLARYSGTSFTVPSEALKG